jgi:hypothetical protein
LADIRFEVGGRSVSPDRFSDEIEKAIYSQVRDNIAKALRGVRCPEHGETPKVVVKGRSMKDLSWEVHGCCQALIDRAVQQLK